ncbi:unnamed protein product [Zymoseptoria tritici ST99CH_1A5]|uniref:GH16 domain-containing protein n=2 Tax=Zymoseptoria tritici TaxID=1047171 RepID=A0A2H1GNT5_ZYMTR|nr:unnamed protein product [Zymoseptoria tritici ST99CH_1E4]SMY26037.1 unnamed protein product [Zymoseptoria tritici ST99CH_1A5]
MYASVSTYAILTDEAGICNGMFFYHNDSQEIDIEWISDPESTSNQGTNNGTRVMQYTNQGPHGTEDSFEINGRASGDATSAVHEYRIDWTQGVSTFYLDGVTSSKLTVTFLRLLGRGLGMRGREFRSRNGDPDFTVGPPQNDAVFKIQRIVMRYNTTADGSRGEIPSMSNTSQSSKESAGPQSGGSSGIALAGPATLFSLAVAGSLIARWLS